MDKYRHVWNDDGERCLVCGDKDWMADPSCSPSQEKFDAFFKFTEEEYQEIYDIVFQDDYPGYRPSQVEVPGGDGKVDWDKRYAHVAVKYLDKYDNDANKKILYGYLERAHELSMRVAHEIGLIGTEYEPDFTRGALRILEYPAGAITHSHNDFDLYTLMMYRNLPEHFHYDDGKPSKSVSEMNDQIHYGLLMKEMSEGRIKPHRHSVSAADETQKSIVYFTLPPWETMLPSGISVGDWLEDIMSRTRIYT